MKKVLLILIIVFQASSVLGQEDHHDTVSLLIAGLSHDHVHWAMQLQKDQKIQVTGIYESDQDLRERYARQYNLDENLFYTDLDTALKAVQPDAVAAFGPVYNHLKVVEAAAPLGIEVMVEKPLAANLKQAKKIKELAEKYDIEVITNYETTWYASNQAIYDRFHDQSGYSDIRKMVAQDGHQGPKEIGVSKEFFKWLTNPKLNGGGALMDFGCYGANLMTWMMDGQKPITVHAVTQQIKPDIYPDVDDEATIILTYPKTQGIIQASWNWPYNRKDFQVYGRNSYVFAEGGNRIEFMKNGNESSQKVLEDRPSIYSDPFLYLAAVVQGDITVDPKSRWSLENNMTVMPILEAAKRSAESGRAVNLSGFD